MSAGDLYKNVYLDSAYGDDHGDLFPDTGYLALFDGKPTTSGGGVELSGDGYAPVAITNNSTNWPDAVDGLKTNGVAFVFPAASADWDEATYWAIKDGVSGSVVDYGRLQNPVQVLSGRAYFMSAGSIVLGVQDG